MYSIKKIYRRFNKHILINFVKIIDPLFDKIGIYLHPKFGELQKYNLTYAKKSRRYLINKEKKSFNKPSKKLTSSLQSSINKKSQIKYLDQ